MLQILTEQGDHVPPQQEIYTITSIVSGLNKKTKNKNTTEETNLLVNQIFSDVYLSQGQLIMVFVIQHIHQISIERMDVLKGKKKITHFQISPTETRRNSEHTDLRRAWGSRTGSV